MFFSVGLIFTIFVCAANGQNLSAFREESWPSDLSVPFPYRTPSPINIVSSEVRLLHCPSPLKVVVGLLVPTTVINDGTSVRVKPNWPFGTVTLTGGVLGAERYLAEEIVYHWNGDYINYASALIDGVGSALVVNTIYRNLKYPNLIVARQHRDGLANIIVNVNVAGQAPNLLFSKFENILRRIRRSGSSVTEWTTLPEFIWFDQILYVNHYYAYPGAFYVQNGNHTEEYDCSTIIQFPREMAPFISVPQFQSFLQLLNPSNTPYTSILPTYDRENRPVVEVVGSVQIMRPIAV